MFAVYRSRNCLAFVALAFTALLSLSNAFQLSPFQPAHLTSRSFYIRKTHLFETRRDVLDHAPTSCIAFLIATTTTIGSVQSAEASGGATAGGAYLLSVRITNSLTSYCVVFTRTNSRFLSLNFFVVS